MIFSKYAISLLFTLLLFSIFMAHLLKIIATDHNHYIEDKIDGKNHTRYLSQKYGLISDTPRNLIWFIQVSVYLNFSFVMSVLIERETTYYLFQLSLYSHNLG